ncbi:LytR/AlgR family response regulator transcription factor [Thaumasiovibrio subtropicus]|uniref:LytR/AlgR family response regulator transcription factor n=1 Tax=Thaumasiovibrio subtropicus TaxID=1891207 RepID=UPI000B35DE79|nr:LytTR family DNA-binding domain-containing protein [Thaumasiovibrio subtropicus]
MNPRAVIADDEPLLRHHMKQSLAEVWPELEIVGVAENGTEALAMIEEHQPEIAFLDIRMPEIDGMTVACRLKKRDIGTNVVFTTAYDEYAVEAFDASAIDYLLKPLTLSRLERACEKVKQRIEQSVPQDYDVLLSQLKQYSSPQQPTHLKWIKAMKREEIHLIPVSEVIYFKAEDKYVSVFQCTGVGQTEEYIIRTPLKELIQSLDPDFFWQIHRSTVVNAAMIDKVKKDFSGRMSVFVGDKKLAVSRSAQSLFKGM